MGVKTNKSTSNRLLQLKKYRNFNPDIDIHICKLILIQRFVTKSANPNVFYIIIVLLDRI